MTTFVVFNSVTRDLFMTYPRKVICESAMLDIASLIIRVNAEVSSAIRSI